MACSGVVASRSMHDCHGPSSMPFFRSMAQMTTSRQATRLPMSTFSPPLLPDPVVPPKMPCSRAKRHPARRSILEWPQIDRLGNRRDRRAGPRNGPGVRVHIQHADLAPVGQVIRRRVNAHRAPECPQAGFDLGDLRDHVANGLAACQPEPGAPSPHIDGGGHDLGPGQPDGFGDIGPGLQLAVEPDFRAPAPMRPPRHRQDERADYQCLRKRRQERADRRRGRNPDTGRVDGDGRVNALGKRRESPPRAEQGHRPRGHAGQHREGQPPVRPGAVQPPGGRHQASGHAQRARARSGTARPTAPAARPRSRGTPSPVLITIIGWRPLRRARRACRRIRRYVLTLASARPQRASEARSARPGGTTGGRARRRRTRRAWRASRRAGWRGQAACARGRPKAA